VGSPALSRVRTLPRALAVAAVALSALTGCGSGDSVGDSVGGTGYTFEIPQGWQRLPFDEPSSFRPDALIGVPRGKRTLPNINVVVGPVSANMSLSRFSELSTKPLLQNPRIFGFPAGTDIRVVRKPSATKLDGESALQEDLVAETGSEALKDRSIVALHGTTSYVVTYTDTEKAFHRDLPGLATVFETWEWD
jgi:hypothetical protein